MPLFRTIISWLGLLCLTLNGCVANEAASVYQLPVPKGTPRDLISDDSGATPRGTPELLHARSQELFRAKEYAKAHESFYKAAAFGYAPSQYMLARMYAEGLGGAQDLAFARFWYERSARQGYAPAQNNLGVMLARGEGGEADPTQAAMWYTKAAGQGNVAAQANLGFMYLQGFGIKKDVVQARHWLGLAAERGDANAQEALRALAGGDVRPSDGIVREPMPGTANDPLASAEKDFAQGIACLNGKGVAQDYGRALRLFTRAAQLDHSSAQYYLGMMHEQGLGVPSDPVIAYRWYLRAAAGGDAMAKERGKALEKRLTPTQKKDAAGNR